MVRLADQARDHWPIITGSPVLEMCRENAVFRVATVFGPAALRLHRPDYHSDAILQSEVDWLFMLTKGGIKMPTPYPSQNGAFLVRLSDQDGTSRMAALQSWLDGKPLGRTAEPFTADASTMSEIFHAIGATLARTHNLADHWEKPKSFARPSWDFDGLVGDEPFWGRFWEIKGVSADETDLLARIRGRCRQDLAQFLAGGADFGLIHADLARENILIDGKTIWFIDFDDGGFGYRLFDIATALFKNLWEPYYERLQTSLLAGYETERPLTPRDKQALPLFLVLRSLAYVGWIHSRGEPGMEIRKKRMMAQSMELSSAYLASDVS